MTQNGCQGQMTWKFATLSMIGGLIGAIGGLVLLAALADNFERWWN